jgi:hypothetical protein
MRHWLIGRLPVCRRRCGRLRAGAFIIAENEDGVSVPVFIGVWPLFCWGAGLRALGRTRHPGPHRKGEGEEKACFGGSIMLVKKP